MADGSVADPAGASPVDRFLPDWHVRQVATRTATVSAASLYAAALALPLARVVRGFGLPAAPESGRDWPVDPDIPVLTAIVSRGDVAVLSEQSGVEFVVGAVAAPGPRGTSVRAVRADAFEAFDEPGFFKAVLGLRTAPQPDGGSVAVLELRGHALDGEVERHLRRSWRRIRWTYAVAARRFLELAEREAARPGATGEPPSMDR